MAALSVVATLSLAVRLLIVSATLSAAVLSFSIFTIAESTDAFAPLSAAVTAVLSLALLIAVFPSATTLS